MVYVLYRTLLLREEQGRSDPLEVLRRGCAKRRHPLLPETGLEKGPTPKQGHSRDYGVEVSRGRHSVYVLYPRTW